MKRLVAVFLFCLLSCSAGWGHPGTDTSSDLEQTYLELHYMFENQLGVKVDTMQNLALYKEICSWIGTPYRYSGESMDGIDCSGFVSSVYKKVYAQPLAASSKEIFNRDVIPLKQSELREGDLVFFRIRKKSVSHVGIYLGENLFVHASHKLGVVISSLEEPYYARYFYKGGRIKN